VNPLKDEKWIKVAICIGLAAVTFAAYEPMRHNGFVRYDDPVYITENPVIQAGITRQSLSQAFEPHYFMWHPLTTLSHMLDCQLFGLKPFGHHFTNLLIHITIAVLLFWILTNITGSIWASAFVAAVFALHPLQVESVAWAAERKTVLSGLFWFLTMAVYIWYAKKPGIGRYVILFLIYGLCIMTKPSVITLPLVLLLLDYWPLGRFDELKPILQLKRLFLEKIPLLGLSAVLGVMTIIAQKSGGIVITTELLSIDYRIGNMFVSYIRYIGKLIWPSGLSVNYPMIHPDSLKLPATICLVVFVLITIICVYTGRRKKYAATGWLWFVGTLVPMIGLVQSGSASIANRYMYISMLGLVMIIAWSARDLIGDRPGRKILAAVLTGVMLLTLIFLTRQQVRYWQTSVTLFEYALKVTKDNVIAENNYGCFLLDEGRFDEAIEHLSNAVRIKPGYYDGRNNLGKAYLKQGKLNDAADCFRETIKLKQDSAEANYNLALVLSMQKKYDEAIKYYNRAIEFNPGYSNAHKKLGEALLAKGKTAEAVAHFHKALPASASKGEIYANLGKAYLLTGNNEQAIENWTKAVELKAGNIEILNNLAWLLATRDKVTAEDAGRAIEYAKRVCELTGNKESVPLDTLAVSYAAAGKFPDAIATARKALELATTAKQEKLAAEIRERMKLYEAGQRYEQK